MIDMNANMTPMTVQIPADLLAEVRRVAGRTGMTVDELVQEACAQWVIQQGIGPTLTLLIGLLLNGMTILDITYTIQNLIKSSVLLGALTADALLNPRDEQTSQQGDI